MKVRITFYIDDDRRRALRARWGGRKGLATREEIIEEIVSTIEILFDDHLADYEAAQEKEA